MFPVTRYRWSITLLLFLVGAVVPHSLFAVEIEVGIAVPEEIHKQLFEQNTIRSDLLAGVRFRRDDIDTLSENDSIQIQFPDIGVSSYLVSRSASFPNGITGVTASSGDFEVASVTISEEGAVGYFEVSDKVFKLVAIAVKDQPAEFFGYLFLQQTGGGRAIDDGAIKLPDPASEIARKISSIAPYSRVSQSSSQMAQVEDTVIDSDGDGLTDFVEHLIGTDPDADSTNDPLNVTPQIDLLMLYTDTFEQDVGTSNIELEINNLIQLANEQFNQSDVEILFSPSRIMKTDYKIDGNIRAAWSKLNIQSIEFQHLDFYRILSGADIVVLVDGYFRHDEGFCGIANVPSRTGGNLLDYAEAAFIVLHLPGNGINLTDNCPVATFAHELGHVMGMAHSRTAAVQGTYDWSVGHGQAFVFRTIMADHATFEFGTRVNLFSNPELICRGQPCGISIENTEEAAHSALALNITKHQVARYATPPPLLGTTTLSGSASEAQIRAGAIAGFGTTGAFQSTFDTDTFFKLAGTIQLDPDDVGAEGFTFVLARLEDGTNLQLNSEGDFVVWDGDPDTLLGNIEPRPLNQHEDIIVLDRFQAGREGVPPIVVEFFFGYHRLDQEEIVFSETGLSIEIL